HLGTRSIETKQILDEVRKPVVRANQPNEARYQHPLFSTHQGDTGIAATASAGRALHNRNRLGSRGRVRGHDPAGLVFCTCGQLIETRFPSTWVFSSIFTVRCFPVRISIPLRFSSRKLDRDRLQLLSTARLATQLEVNRPRLSPARKSGVVPR